MDTTTEKEKMLRGELYTAFVPELILERAQCAEACNAFNRATSLSHIERAPWVEPPFRCDYGYNITLGEGVFINFNCVILDTCKVHIGSRTLIGPSVSLFPGSHPNSAAQRDGLKGPEFGKPITIGENCWIGGNAVVLPGVTIGSGCVVGAGAVVTKDVPPNCVVAGNPARVIKRLEGGVEVKPEVKDGDVQKLLERLEGLEVEMRSIKEELKKHLQD